MSLLRLIAARWGTGSGEIDDVQMDPMTKAAIGINYAHQQAHAGTGFISDFVDEAMNDNETIILAFKTMAGTARAHMLVEFNTLVGGDMVVWEGPTWTTNTGAVNPIFNRKRLASMTSSGILEDLSATPDFTATDNILSNVTGLNVGSAVQLHHWFAWGKKEKFAAGGTRDSAELILKPATRYAVVFTAEGGSNKAQVILNWYEKTDDH